MRFFFRKREKLTSENEIELLFKGGKSNFIYPIKVIFVKSEHPVESKVLITASKRYLKKAVERNLLKRRMREAYRLNSSVLKSILIEKNIKISIAFIYTSSKIIAFDKIEAIIIKQIMYIVNSVEKIENEN